MLSSWLDASVFWDCVMVECLACQLTDTIDAGSSPHMAKVRFLNVFPR